MSNYETTTNSVYCKNYIRTNPSIVEVAMKDKNGYLLLGFYPIPDYSWFRFNGTKSNGVKWG